MNPVITYYDDGDTLISSGNPVSFADTEKGTVSSIVTIWVWNDRAQAGADSALNPKFHAVSGPGDASQIFDGTDWNSYQPMLEARSCGAMNVAADRHEDWIPIGPMNFLSIGNLISYSAREIEIRLNVPGDSSMLSLTAFSFRLQY